MIIVMFNLKYNNKKSEKNLNLIYVKNYHVILSNGHTLSCAEQVSDNHYSHILVVVPFINRG